MTGVPIVFAVAVIVNEEGMMTRCFDTVDTEEEVRQRCKKGESLLGIFPVCLLMEEMELYMKHSNNGSLARRIAARFFDAGYREGVRRGEENMRQLLRPMIDDVLSRFSQAQLAQEEIERLMSSINK